MHIPPLDGIILLDDGHWFDAGKAVRYLPPEPRPSQGVYRTGKGVWVLWGQQGYVRGTKARVIQPAEAVKWLMMWGHPVTPDLSEHKAALEV